MKKNAVLNRMSAGVTLRGHARFIVNPLTTERFHLCAREEWTSVKRKIYIVVHTDKSGGQNERPYIFMYFVYLTEQVRID